MKSSILVIIPIFILIGLFFSSCATSFNLPEPKLIPSVMSKEDSIILGKGELEMYYKEYKKAIKIYKEILPGNRSNLPLLYNLSYAYFKRKKYDSTFKYAGMGCEYKSDLLYKFYLITGTSLWRRKKRKDANTILQKGIDIYPYDSEYHLKLSGHYEKDDNGDYVVELLKTIQLDATSAIPHYHLGRYYLAHGKHIHALFALLRFVELDPDNEKNEDAIDMMKKILNHKKGTRDPFEYLRVINRNYSRHHHDMNSDMADISTYLDLLNTHSLSVEAFKYDDDFWTITEKHADTDEMFNAYLNLISNFIIRKAYYGSNFYSFVGSYYMPYFVQMYSNDHLKTYLKKALMNHQPEKSEKWLEKNVDKVTYYDKWTKEYEWPSLPWVFRVW